jgi:hypothetical protein
VASPVLLNPPVISTITLHHLQRVCSSTHRLYGLCLVSEKNQGLAATRRKLLQGISPFTLQTKWNMKVEQQIWRTAIWPRRCFLISQGFRVEIGPCFITVLPAMQIDCKSTHGIINDDAQNHHSKLIPRR